MELELSNGIKISVLDLALVGRLSLDTRLSMIPKLGCVASNLLEVSQKKNKNDLFGLKLSLNQEMKGLNPKMGWKVGKMGHIFLIMSHLHN